MVDAIRSEFRFAPPFVAELLRHFDGDFLTLDPLDAEGGRPSIDGIDSWENIGKLTISMVNVWEI